MKKYLTLLLCVCVLSCSKEPIGESTFSICASIENDGLTKTYMDSGDGDIFHVMWSEGDEIAVYDDGGISEYSLNEGAGTRLASFAGSRLVSGSCSAFYPYDMVRSVSGNEFRIRLPEQQNYVENSFSPGSYPMVAAGSPDNLMFHNLCSVIRLFITGNVKLDKIVFSPRDLQTFVAGDAVVSDDKLRMCDDGSREITLNVGGMVLSENENSSFDIVVPAQTYENGFDITLVSIAGSVMTKSYDKTFTTEKSCIHFAKPFRFVPERSTIAVDLGLSVKWASYNIGAGSCEELGTRKKWDKYYINREILKYNDSDHKTILDLEDDPAYVNWGSECRVPTASEWNELITNCYYNRYAEDEENGMRGTIFTSKINGNSIFLPINVSGDTDYLSSELSENYICGVVHFNNRGYFSSAANFSRTYPYEYYVRPVFPPADKSILEVTPESYDFGLVEVGKSAETYFTIHNSGRKDLHISSIDLPEGFSTEFSGGTIKGGENIVIKVVFSPKDIKPVYGPIAFKSDADIVKDNIVYAEGIDAIGDDSYEPKFVNLGLSVKWADRDLGALNPYSSGDPYAWGEIETKDVFERSTYKWGDTYHLSKYVSEEFNRYYTEIDFYDDKTQLDPEDDAAYVKSGGAYRMPTADEIQELIANCRWNTVSINGVSLLKATSKINGAYIYIKSDFWSSTIDIPRVQQDKWCDWAHCFFTIAQDQLYANSRFVGYMIRPVKD